MPAKKELSLLPDSENINSNWGRALRWLTTVGRFVIVVTELVVVSAFLSRFYLDRKNADLSETLRQQKAILESTKEFESEFDFLQARINYIKTFRSTDAQLTSKLSLLASSIPPDVIVSALNVTNGQVPKTQIHLIAYTLQQDSIITMVTNMSLNPQIKSIEIARIEKKTKDNKYVIELNLIMDNGPLTTNGRT